MMKLEEELERRIREPAILTMPNNSVVLNNNRIPVKKQSKKMLPKPPRDIETLISTNLSKLRSNSPRVSKAEFKPYQTCQDPSDSR